MKNTINRAILFFAILTSSKAFSNDCFDLLKHFVSRSEMKQRGWTDLEVSINVRSKFKPRVELGEISPKKLETLMDTLESYQKATNQSLLGVGMNTCFEEFSDEAASSLTELIIKTKNSKDSKSAFDKLVAGAQEIYGDTPASAKIKICALTDGTRCQIFSKNLARHCK